MINITEIVPSSKVSGKSSFLVSFPYNALVVEALKDLPSYYYHKKDYIWEVPANLLSKLLDSLTFLDDIQLTLHNDAEIDPISFKPITDTEINSLGFAPYKHQIEGINYGLDKKKWLLLDNPGCGKTNQIIGLAETLYNRKMIDHCLIIVGINSLKSNWRKEIKKFGKQNCIIIGERFKKDGSVSKTPSSIVERVDQLKKPIDEFFVILNVESFRDERILKAIQTGPNKFDMIAIDEVHKCLDGNTVIATDIGDMTIADICNNDINCKVLSYNTKTGKQEYKSILSKTVSQPNEPMLELEIQADDGSIQVIHCTASHRFYTANRGYVKAKDLQLTDELFTRRSLLGGGSSYVKIN